MIKKAFFSKFIIYCSIIVSAYLLITVKFNQNNFDESQVATKDELSKIESSAINIYQTQYDQTGNKKLDLKALKFTQHTNGKQEFSKPHFYFFNAEQSTDQTSILNWVITSDRAEINQPNIVEVIDNVQGKRLNGTELSFQTEWLNYDVINTIATSDADILVWQQQNTIESEGFDVSLISNKIDIQLHNNVRINALEETK